MKAYLTTMKCYGLLFACLFFPSIALANQEQPPWVAEAQNLGLEVSISVENFPPVSVQKFPHGLAG